MHKIKVEQESASPKYCTKYRRMDSMFQHTHFFVMYLISSTHYQGASDTVLVTGFLFLNSSICNY